MGTAPTNHCGFDRSSQYTTSSLSAFAHPLPFQLSWTLPPPSHSRSLAGGGEFEVLRMGIEILALSRPSPASQCKSSSTVLSPIFFTDQGNQEERNELLIVFFFFAGIEPNRPVSCHSGLIYNYWSCPFMLSGLRRTSSPCEYGEIMFLLEEEADFLFNFL